MKFIADTEENYTLVLNDDNTFLNITTADNFGEVISSSQSNIDTGIINQTGSGIISYRKKNDYTQIAYQQAPGDSLVKWGEYERDDDAEVFRLAHPYKIWIVDFHKDLLVGLRHFFAVEPIFDGSEKLYHTPYPNTNCKGYSRTSVGWVCLYRNDTEPLVSVQEKVQYAWQRESGLHEPYNNSNMSETDGPRFYHSKDITIFSDPSAWQELTLNEGFEWTLDESNLIPILTSDEMHLKHAPEGNIYTFSDSINLPYYPYYSARLSDENKAFYEKGWGSSSSLEKFDKKVLSKLGLVDAPNSIDVNSILKKYGIKEHNAVNFEVFDVDERIDFTSFVLNSRHECCMCGKYSGQMTFLALYFTTHKMTNDVMASHILADDFPYIIGYTVNESTPGLPIENHICDSCIDDDNAVIVQTIAGPLNFDNIQSMNIALLTKKGLNSILKNDNYVEAGYKASYDGSIRDAGDSFHARCMVNAEGVSSYPVPENHTVTCLQCNTSHLYEFDEDGKPDFYNDSHYGILYDEVYPSVFNARFTINCAKCSDRIVPLSKFSLDLGVIQEKIEFKNYVDSIENGKGEVFRPLSEMSWLFNEHFFDMNSLVFNDLDDDSRDKFQVLDVAHGTLHNNFLVDIYPELDYSFETIRNLDGRDSFSYENFDEMFGAQPCHVGLVERGLIWEISVIAGEVEDNKITCACDFQVEPNEIHSAKVKEGNPACITCVYNNESYKPLITNGKNED